MYSKHHVPLSTTIHEGCFAGSLWIMLNWNLPYCFFTWLQFALWQYMGYSFPSFTASEFSLLFLYLKEQCMENTHQVLGQSELISLVDAISQSLPGIQRWICITHTIINTNSQKCMGANSKQNVDLELLKNERTHAFWRLYSIDSLESSLEWEARAFLDMRPIVKGKDNRGTP